MSRIVSRAEAWERAYEVFQQVNFSAFDYTTIKQSMIEYVKIYFPEDFNDYIESSEFVAILELFAYVAELLAYRLDLNAHENFITTAQRKSSILRLAKLIGYKASRNIPARGLAKIQSISTTETVLDANGVNLANTRVRWNDPNNPNWKEQFLLIINRIFEQPFGTVSPDERVQVQDVVFELYDMENTPTFNGVQRFSVTVSGQAVELEIVPQVLEQFGPTERRPERNRPMAITYANDGLGDGSDTTGFMFFVKQGRLNRQGSTFDGVTPNQTFTLTNSDINETDVWVNNIDPDTGEVLDNGKWQEVSTVAAQNIIFNTLDTRNKYEIETLEQDGVRVIFGDGEFATIPSGTFDFWNRTSLADPVVIPQTAVQGQVASFTYEDVAGNVQTITFTFSLINSLTNASPSESINNIRRVAPSVYYTQDRMVNAQDYNTFMLQDPSIAKLRSVNRTFAGDSKYITWHDPSETYENVKIFGNDLRLYYEEGEESRTVPSTVDVDDVIDSFIEPLLSTSDFSNAVAAEGVALENIRREFTTAERTALDAVLTNASSSSPTTVQLFYSVVDDQWEFTTDSLTSPPQGQDPLWEPLRYSDTSASPFGTYRGEWNNVTTYNANDLVYQDVGSPQTREYYVATVAGSPYISTVPSGSPVTLTGSPLTPFNRWNQYAPEGIIQVTFDISVGWTVVWKTYRLIAESESTRFWNTNEGDNVVTFDALNNLQDRIVVLNANIGGSPRQILPGNISFIALQQQNNENGLPSISKLVVTPEDTNNDGIPDFSLSFGGSPYAIGPLIAPSRNEYLSVTPTYTPYNFAWFHYAADRNLIDPAASNIIDTFIIPRGYIEELNQWLEGSITVEPTPPTPLQLRNDYGYLLDNKMISDTVILRPGRIRLLFGSKAEPQLRAQLKVIKRQSSLLTNNQIKTRVVNVTRAFFDVDLWEFGETFFFTELAAAIHEDLGSEISSVVLVPTFGQNQFGDLFQIVAREDEIFQADIDVEDVIIVNGFNDNNLRVNPS